MPSSVNPLTITREELYELVWSKPMVELAKDFGLSDVALAKRCRKLGVPVPGRGYWARVAAGQTPRQAPLKKRSDESTDYSSLTFDAPREEPEHPKPPPSADQETFRARIEQLEIKPEVDLLSASGPIKRAAVRLKRPWHHQIAWNRGERSGPTVQIDVAEGVADRALRLCERLLSSAESLGWPFGLPPKPREEKREFRRDYDSGPTVTPAFGVLLVKGEALAFRLDERRRQLDHVLTEDEKASKRRREFVHPPRWDFHPTGELRLHMSEAGSRYTLHTWKDTARKPLEEQIQTILIGFLDRALLIRAHREERRLEAIEERRRQILELEQSDRRRANAELIRALEIQAGAWFRARLLRKYLGALRRTVGNARPGAKLQGKPVDFIEWAEHYVEQLDPLSEAPRHPDLLRDRHGYYGSGEKTIEELGRLLGHDWQDSWKIDSEIESEDIAADPENDEAGEIDE